MITTQLNWQLRGIATPKIHLLLQCQGSTLVQGFRHRIFTGRESKCAVSMKGALECASKEFFSEELNSWWALQTPGKPDAFYRTRTSIFMFTQPTQVTEPSDKEYRAVRQPTTTLQVGKYKTKNQNQAVLCCSAQQVDHSKLIVHNYLYLPCL